MHSTRARWLVVVVAGIASLAGCQEGTATTPPPATPTPAPIVTPAPPPTSPVADRFNESDEPLEPGRYTRGQFVPRVTFEVGEGWLAVEAGARFWNIQKNAGSRDAVSVIFARPDGIYAAPGRLMAPTTARAAAELLQANASIGVLDSSASLMSGVEGIVLEIESVGPEALVVHVPPRGLGLPADGRIWLALFDTPEGVLAIMVQGSAARWDDVLAAAEPVLESVTIGL